MHIPTSQGHPAMPHNLAGMDSLLVDYCRGPSNGALAWLLLRLHTHPGFHGMGVVGRSDGNVIELHRSIAEWMRKTVARLRTQAPRRKAA